MQGQDVHRVTESVLALLAPTQPRCKEGR
jgi:hypothetical protein